MLALLATPFAPGKMGLGAVPAAEALGRDFRGDGRFVRNASDVTDISAADRCQIDLSISGDAAVRAGQGVSRDYFCFSYTDRAIVTLTATADSIPYRAYLPGGRPAAGAQAWHPGVRVEDGRDRHLGRGAGNSCATAGPAGWRRWPPLADLAAGWPGRFAGNCSGGNHHPAAPAPVGFFVKLPGSSCFRGNTFVMPVRYYDRAASRADRRAPPFAGADRPGRYARNRIPRLNRQCAG